MTFDSYDKAGNRTELSDNWGDRVFGYDVLDRLLSATNSTEAYTYDVVGNRLTGPNGEKYTYDSANRLIGISGPVSATFTYDADGNLTSQTVNNVPIAYTWNNAGQLVGVTKDGKTVTFSYDALGRRIGKTADGKGTAFVYDGAEVTFALDATDPEKKPGGYFVHGPGIDNHLAAVFGDTPDSGEHYYYHVDGLGSVTSVTNSTGQELATNRYDSFGKLVAQTGSLPFASTYTYTGREWDAEAGLYYYRARYYDPSLGRFISEDPIGFAGGTNFYAYVENNPLKWVDPWGLWNFASEYGTTGTDLTSAITNIEDDVDSIYDNIVNHDATVTFTTNGTHTAANSRHYTGNAVDLRVWGFTAAQRQQAVDTLRRELGSNYGILDETDHIHVEYDPQPTVAPVIVPNTSTSCE